MGRVIFFFDDFLLCDDLCGFILYGVLQVLFFIVLNVNENMYQILDVVVSDIFDDIVVVICDVNCYLDWEFIVLCEVFVEYFGYGFVLEQIWVGNGFNEVFQYIFQVFGGFGCIVFGFVFMYLMYLLIVQGIGVCWIVGICQFDYMIILEEVVEQVCVVDFDVVIFCLLNNLMGMLFGLDVVEVVYEVVWGIVIVDEVYQEFVFCDVVLVLMLFDGCLWFVILWIMSKVFVFVGVCVGYLVVDFVFIDVL